VGGAQRLRQQLGNPIDLSFGRGKAAAAAGRFDLLGSIRKLQSAYRARGPIQAVGRLGDQSSTFGCLQRCDIARGGFGKSVDEMQQARTVVTE
jgi:hypothetical protein